MLGNGIKTFVEITSQFLKSLFEIFDGSFFSLVKFLLPDSVIRSIGKCRKNPLPGIAFEVEDEVAYGIGLGVDSVSYLVKGEHGQTFVNPGDVFNDDSCFCLFYQKISPGG